MRFSLISIGAISVTLALACGWPFDGHAVSGPVAWLGGFGSGLLLASRVLRPEPKLLDPTDLGCRHADRVEARVLVRCPSCAAGKAPLPSCEARP